MTQFLSLNYRASLSYDKVVDTNDLMEKLIAFARRHKYANKRVSGDTLVIQKSSTWLMLTGLSATLRILVLIEQDTTKVLLRDYNKEFQLKLFISIPVFILSFPLTISFHTNGLLLPIHLILALPAFGAFRQYKLIEDIKAEIDDYFAAELKKSNTLS
jgi:hypothetical protein